MANPPVVNGINGHANTYASTVADMNNPPPSTLAAQLAERRQTSTSDAAAENLALFQQLLDEARRYPVDPDPQQNLLLVSIIAEVGLSLSTRERSLDGQLVDQNAQSRFLASLEVIEKVVRRAPNVLFMSDKPDSPPGSVLFFLILSRLIDLMGLPALQKPAAHSISVLVDALSRRPETWQDAATLRRVIQSAATDLLSIMDSQSKKRPSRSFQYDFAIPTASMLHALIGITSQTVVATSQSHKVMLKSPAHAIHVILTIVSATVRRQIVDDACAVGTVTQKEYTWAISTLRAVLRLFQHYMPVDTISADADSGNVFRSMLESLLVISHVASPSLQPSAVALIIQVSNTLLSLDGFWDHKSLTDQFSKSMAAVALPGRLLDQAALPARACVVEKLRNLLRESPTSKLPDHVSAELQLSLDALCEKSSSKSHEAQMRLHGSNRAEPDTVNGFSLPLRLEEDNETPGRISKRQRTSPDGHDPSANALLRDLCVLFVNWDPANLAALVDCAAELFEDLATDSQYEIIRIFGRVQCQAAKEHPSQTTDEQPCSLCGGSQRQNLVEEEQLVLYKRLEHVHDAMMTIMESRAVQQSKPLRVAAMLAIQQLVCHSPSKTQIDLNTSSAGKWCLQGLRSSSRELRMVSAQTLPTFMRSSIDPEGDLCHSNRRVALNYLRELTQTDDQRFFETIVLALGNVFSVCDDHGASLVLSQFFDFLGHSNPIISGQANIEIRRLASQADVTVGELLRPYWNVLAIPVVKDIFKKPQKAQQVADLLGGSVNQLLDLTQSYCIPYFLLNDHIDVLQRIGAHKEPSRSAYDVCTTTGNLATILSYLVTQFPGKSENAVLECFRKLDPNLRPDDAEMLVKIDPVASARETLKVIAEASDDLKANAQQGFRDLTTMVERRGHATRTSTTQARMTTLFFQNHALGIMASFSDSIEDKTVPIVEKRRSIMAIAAMIELGQGDVAVAVPQIRACLQSAIDVPRLCDDAFSTWLKLSNILQAEELESFICQTFTIIVRKWDWLSPKSRDTAYNAVLKLFENHSVMIQDSVDAVPSLAPIPIFSKIESQLQRLRDEIGVSQRLATFARRCQDENSTAIHQTLEELLPYLCEQEPWIHNTTNSEQPDQVVADLLKALLDACARFNEGPMEIVDLCAQCLGVIGCVDANRIEVSREQNDLIVLSNFGTASEAIDFAVYFLRNVLVKAFHTVSNPRAQGFLAYAMQELLRFCGFSKDAELHSRSQTGQGDESTRRWTSLPEAVKSTLTPFLSSRYVLTTNQSSDNPRKHNVIFSPDKPHGAWLRDLTLDLLGDAKGDNAQMIFKVLSRVIRGYDLTIAATLLPFAAANIIIDGSLEEGLAIGDELLRVLQQPTESLEEVRADNVRQCSQDVFSILDYLSRWLQEKRRVVMHARVLSERAGNQRSADDAANDALIGKVEAFLKAIPPETISLRAQECGSFTRALLHWEQHIRNFKTSNANSTGTDEYKSEYDEHLMHLQDLYSKIDEPDGIDGISNLLITKDLDLSALQHQRAGRWDAAKSWYEIQLSENSQDLQMREKYLGCLTEAGEFTAITEHASASRTSLLDAGRLQGAIARAAWSTENWSALETAVRRRPTDVIAPDFDIGVGSALWSLKNSDNEELGQTIGILRGRIARRLSNANNATLQSCHELLLQLHALHEVEAMTAKGVDPTSHEIQTTMTSRLDTLGSSVADKQYLLALRRAILRLVKPQDDSALVGLWIRTAKLARKSLPSSLAYKAVFQAATLSAESANIEHAKLLWNAGEHRRALNGLLAALSVNHFPESGDVLGSSTMTGPAMTASMRHSARPQTDIRQSLPLAKAQLLYARWLDESGQTNSDQILQRYRAATFSFQKWEKGFYYLGRFYNKMLESEKALPLNRQGHRYLSGEMAKLVIENYLRSITFGCRNLAQALPKLLTLWLELGDQVLTTLSKAIPDDVRARAAEQRPKMVDQINKQIKKYSEKIMPFVFYTALPQMLTRITHANPKVWELLSAVIAKATASFPQQALWSVLAVVKSSDPTRARRGNELVLRIRNRGNKVGAKIIRSEGQSVDMNDLVARGQKLTEELIRACDVQLDTKTQYVSLTHHMGFKTRVAPCPLVVPWEKMLTASLPTGTTDFQQMKAHRAFPASREAVTVSSFEDNVLVLNSLQKPRRVTIKGSDGRSYSIMCKPHDDLRKDQRLMEFNGMINRALKKDTESALRRLKIGTYAVTPLNEFCGVLEWVEGLKPMRDILISLYKSKGTRIEYGTLRELLNDACMNPPETTKIFTETILGQYKPVLHEWFTEHFPAPDAWYAARKRYARSCAASSMVGHALGLGDRHGENVLLVERDGSVFHVDFNCLFDKGLTFEKPELVPFRLTHNMVDAMGSTGVEGFFRQAAECTARMMREQEDVLLTNLETFVYDPTTDFVGRKGRVVKGVPETPKEILESVRSKVEGHLMGESLKMSVQGHVDALIKQARDPARLAAMYIGWCAFL